MRSFIANTIFLFANIITCMMGNYRRSDTLSRSALMLANLRLETKHGNIQLNIGSMNEKIMTIGAFGAELDTVEWIESIPECSCFWDIGANVGIFSMIAAKNINHVYSFEPHAFTYSTLMKNLQYNDMTDKVSAFQIALCDCTRIDMLNMSSNLSGSDCNSFGNNVDQFGRTVNNHSYNIMGYTIDDFIKIFNPIFPTHIKIDVDGLEPQILRRGIETFNSHMLKSVIFETKGPEERIVQIHKIMNQYGFKKRSVNNMYNNTIYDR